MDSSCKISGTNQEQITDSKYFTIWWVFRGLQEWFSCLILEEQGVYYTNSGNVWLFCWPTVKKRTRTQHITQIFLPFFFFFFFMCWYKLHLILKLHFSSLLLYLPWPFQTHILWPSSHARHWIKNFQPDYMCHHHCILGWTLAEILCVLVLGCTSSQPHTWKHLEKEKR